MKKAQQCGASGLKHGDRAYICKAISLSLKTCKDKSCAGIEDV
jgi:hypothetical protein